jgi:hypothetical protein
MTLSMLVSVALPMPSTPEIAKLIETVYAKYKRKQGKRSNLTSPCLFNFHDRQLAAVVEGRSAVVSTHYAMMLGSEVHCCVVDSSHLYSSSSQIMRSTGDSNGGINPSLESIILVCV